MPVKGQVDDATRAGAYKIVNEVTIVSGQPIAIPDGVTVTTPDGTHTYEDGDVIPDDAVIVVRENDGKEVVVDGATGPNPPDHWTADQNRPIAIKVVKAVGVLVIYNAAHASVAGADGSEIVSGETRRKRGEKIIVTPTNPEHKVSASGAKHLGTDKDTGAQTWEVIGTETVKVAVGPTISLPSDVPAVDKDGNTIKDGDVVPPGTGIIVPKEKDGKVVVVDGAEGPDKDGAYIVSGDEPVVVGYYDFILTYAVGQGEALGHFAVARRQPDGTKRKLRSGAGLNAGDYLIVTPELASMANIVRFAISNGPRSLEHVAQFGLEVEGNVSILADFFQQYVKPDTLPNGDDFVNAVDGAAESYAVVPNPAAGAIRVAGLAEAARVQVFNALGVRVLAQALAPGEMLSVLPLKPGYYILRVNGQHLPFVKL